MKTIHLLRVLFFLIALLTITEITLAHKEPTHQYIVREAYKLLKLHLGKSIQEYETYIMGPNGLGNEGEFDPKSQPWKYKTVMGGVWNEDLNDEIEHSDVRSILGIDGMYTSINHFWDPDIDEIGHNSNFELAITWNPYPNGWCSVARWIMENSHASNGLMAYKKALIFHGYSFPEFSEEKHFDFTKNGKTYNSPNKIKMNIRVVVAS